MKKWFFIFSIIVVFLVVGFGFVGYQVGVQKGQQNYIENNLKTIYWTDVWSGNGMSSAFMRIEGIKYDDDSTLVLVGDSQLWGVFQSIRTDIRDWMDNEGGEFHASQNAETKE